MDRYSSTCRHLFGARRPLCVRRMRVAEVHAVHRNLMAREDAENLGFGVELPEPAETEKKERRVYVAGTETARRMQALRARRASDGPC